METLSEHDTKVVRTILLEQLGVTEEQLTPEARFAEDLGADSLTRVEIALSLEDRFNLSIPDEQWEKVATAADLYEALAELLANSGRGARDSD
jgi:acyl carrier protein